MMASMLTYYGGKSTGHNFIYTNQLQYADENYAREIMQLFTIGLYELNNDGTRKVENGDFVRTYTNDDITEYAKVYTGFFRRFGRGNIETDAQFNTWRNNFIDPMMMISRYIDHLPKKGLDNRYIGDGYPLCNDLPNQHFLKAGAKYRLLANDKPTLLNENMHYKEFAPPKRVVLDANSLLGAAMCQTPGESPCTSFKAKVVLAADIASCSGIECDIHDPRVIQVADGIFYEYIRPACVQRAYYPNPKRVNAYWGYHMCADPSSPSAATVCCDELDKGWDGIYRDENFYGERVTYSEAEARCNSTASNQLCTMPYIWHTGCDNTTFGGCDVEYISYWTKADCTLAVKLNVDGTIALVHDVVGLEGVDAQIDSNNQRRMVQNNTVMFFRADWQTKTELDTFLSDYTNNCALLGCNSTSDGYCLCKDVVVDETTAFASLEGVTVEAILSSATFGGFEPDESFFSVAGNSNVKIFPGAPLTSETLLEVIDANGIRRIRKNIKSTVSFGGGSLSFRNPVHFMALDGFDERDAQYQLDATLEHYFYHRNTAPFLAARFAQRFGMANPSPRFVDVAASAFRTGRYITEEGTSFGSGEYGSMEALVAALVLDRESQNMLLDKDPSQ